MLRHLPPLLFLIASPTLAQPAATLDRALAAYEGMMRGVENYTLTQEVMGFETTMYFEREGGADALAYATHLRTPTGWERVSEDVEGMASQAALFRAMRARAHDAGTAVVNGERTVAVRVDDFAGLARYLPTPPDAEAMEIETATFYFGADDHLVRRVSMKGTARQNGHATPVEMDMVYSDFRTVGGMRHPFRTAMTIGGMEGALSPQEREQTRRQLEEARRQMEQMPAQQRQMMERAMGGQLARLEEMLGGEGLEMEMVVTDLQVNAGRPD